MKTIEREGVGEDKQYAVVIGQVALVLKTNRITAAQFLLQPQYTDNLQNISERCHYKCT